jgi:hypothetical protein
MEEGESVRFVGRVSESAGCASERIGVFLNRIP